MAPPSEPAVTDLQGQFGNIDIYLFDQLLRGRIGAGMHVLDSGCGGGRNLVYLLRRSDIEVYASDADPAAVAAVRSLAKELRPGLPVEHIRHEPVEHPSFADRSMDVVVSNAVLHFARDGVHFDAMVAAMWRLLRRGGMLFARLASSIGMESRMQAVGNGRYLMPDGSERYLVDQARLMATTTRLGGTLLDPLKTTIVQDQRCMTTWVMGKA